MKESMSDVGDAPNTRRSYMDDPREDDEVQLQIKRNPSVDIGKLTKSPNFVKKVVEV